MNARLLAAFSIAAIAGTFAFTPVYAQDAMSSSPGSTMSHDSMHRDAMKHSNHKDSMMKKDAMEHGAMKHGTMKHTAMHHGAMMKKDNSMKMKKPAGEPGSSGR